MPDSLSTISAKAGMPPGSLVHVGDVLEDEPRISLIDYSKENLDEQTVEAIDDLLQYKGKETVTWVTIEGLKNVALIDAVGRIFDIHPLVLEDILNTHQRPKIEEYDAYLYIVLKKLSHDPDSFSFDYEQISILLFTNLVITFKEQKDDFFLPIKQRLENNKGRFRSMGADYLAYAILDMIVDQNFHFLDSIDEVIDLVEEELLTDPSEKTLVEIQRIKRELMYARRSISPLRELVAAIMRSETSLIQNSTQLYFRDVYDHVLRITEAIESYREMMSGLLDIYISSVNNKMNEIMKVLTVFASIFIPLTFITGIYGMNFEYMPELKMRWAYPTLWVCFIAIPLVLLTYFKRKKWL